MSRFVSLANSITAVGSFGPIGMRDMNPQDDKGLFQFDSSLGNAFEARIYATLNFDFTLNTGGPWHDVTDRVRPVGESDADFVLVNGKFQKRKESNLGGPIDLAGIYAFDAGYAPAAIFVGVETAPSSGHLDISFGF
ncbi:MAG: hypothetical protein V3S55_03770 [Nitrospiraceae bacterium]